MAGESQAVPHSAPDPSVLTTEQLLREVDTLKALFAAELKGLDQLTLERFHGVDEQLALVERQRVEQKADTKAAVDAALTAQKESVREQTIASGTAIAKSESGMVEQLKQMSVNFQTSIAGVLVTLNDLKDRVVKIESLQLGRNEYRTESRDNGATMRAIIGFGIGLMLAAITVVGFVASKK